MSRHSALQLSLNCACRQVIVQMLRFYRGILEIGYRAVRCLLASDGTATAPNANAKKNGLAGFQRLHFAILQIFSLFVKFSRSVRFVFHSFEELMNSLWRLNLRGL